VRGLKPAAKWRITELTTTTAATTAIT